MPYALVPMIDIGPSLYRPGLQRRMPLGLDQGGNCIHLGPNNALMWTPATIADARAEVLADDKAETLTASRQTVLTNLAGDSRTFPVGQQQFQQVVRSLLVNAPADRRWNPLVSTKRGHLEAWLGPGGVGGNLLFRESRLPRRPASKDITDDFDRTAANLAGSTTSDGQTTWAEDQGTGWVTDGDEADLSGGVTFNVGRLVLAMDTADHYAQPDLSRFSRVGGILAMGVTVRVNATPTSGYGFEVATITDGSHLRRVYNFVTDTTMLSDAVAPATGLLYLEFDGSTYTAKVAGTTVFTSTDTAFDGTVKGVGIAGYSDHASNSAGFTSFRGADLVGPPRFILGTH